MGALILNPCSPTLTIVVRQSCRKRGDRWVVAMNKWQDLTDLDVTKGQPSLRPSSHHN